MYGGERDRVSKGSRVSRMKGDARPVQSRLAMLAAYAIVVMAIIGVVSVLWFVTQTVRELNFDTLGHEFSRFVGLFTSNGDGASWATAVATVALAFATLRLWRSTELFSQSANAQLRADGPYLNVVLLFDDTSLDPSGFPPHPYAKAWEGEDSSDPNLSPLIRGVTPSYVKILVLNRQAKPHGIAAGIKIKTKLFFGASTGAAPDHPFSITREVAIPVLEAGASVVGYLYNVGGLKGYAAMVEDVSYQDVTGATLGSASGVAWISKTPVSNESLARVFSPKKKEYTSATRP